MLGVLSIWGLQNDWDIWLKLEECLPGNFFVPIVMIMPHSFNWKWGKLWCFEFWAQLDWWIIVGDLDDVQGIGRLNDLEQK